MNEREPHPYDPSCPHCIPAILDVSTGALFPPGSPEMVAVMRVWNASSFQERTDFIAFTTSGGLDQALLRRVDPLMARIQAAIQAVYDRSKN